MAASHKPGANAHRPKSAAQRSERGASSVPPPRWLVLAAGGLLCLSVCWAFVRQMDLSTADLGRHLKNGELFMQHGIIPQTNLFSYTHPDYPFVNHHWGTGVLFYAVYQAVGFSGLTVFYALLAALTWGLAVWAAAHRAPPWAAVAVGVALAPLFFFRVEVRPEMLSYLLMATFGLLLERHRIGRLHAHRLWMGLGFGMLLWANLHIFFAFGWALVGARAFEALLHGNKTQFRQLAVAFGLVAAVPLANPAGLAGWLQPFTIFNEYGYMVAENQPVWFMQNRYLEITKTDPQMRLPVLFWVFVWFQAVVLLGLAALATVLAKAPAAKRPSLLLQASWAWLLPSLVFGLMGALAFRAIPVFALVALPLFAAGLGLLAKRVGPGWLPQSALAVGVVSLLYGFASRNAVFSPRVGIPQPDGTYYSLNKPGIDKQVEQCAQFLQTHDVQGPIFNNYDIGGYLIHYLYPRQRLFVDNRPEAYPVRFFREVYNPMQEHEAVWLREDANWRFNAIVFMRHDQTPFAQPFLIRRLKDQPNWAPVFVDDYSIIFVRRSPANEAIIRAYEPLVRPRLGAAGN